MEYNAYSYFEICTVILIKANELGNLESKVKVADIGNTLYSVLISREILEQNEEDFDSVLAGCIKLLQKLIELFDSQLRKAKSPIFDAKFI